MAGFKDNLSKYSVYIAVFLAAIFIITAKNWEKEDRVIGADIISYYAYLPATLIFQDIKLEKHETMKNGIFWPETLPSGARVIKTSMGLSFLYAPFFLGAHAWSKLFGLDAFGYSPVYKIGLLISALFYFFIGLFFLRKILKLYFSENITAITIIAVAVGTNLMYYATREATMSHVYNFALYNIFIWLTIQWHKKQNLAGLLVLGALAGLISLVRPSNIIILAFFFLYNVYSLKSFLAKLRFVFTKFHWFVLMGLAFTAIWIPQMLYWKVLTGDFLFNSYTTERFFFNNPHFIGGLFSYRKGWFIYTPIMVMAILGFVFLFKKMKEFSWAIPLFTLLNMYIIFSWWCWWYGGSYGMRALIDSYGMLAIPMALLFSEVLKYRKYLYKIAVGIVIVLIAQNLFFMRKYKRGSIHWDSMTKEAFWFSYWRISPHSEYWELLEKPDYDRARQGLDAIIEEEN